MDKITIIIPAYNEQDRISGTLQAYYHFFSTLNNQERIDFDILVVLNGCVDNTQQVVSQAITTFGHKIRMIELKEAGKGRAIIAGFRNALKQDTHYIGFVDADMSTEPQYFYELYTSMNDHDGVIASRYLPTSKIYPPRPLIKEWGRKILYNNLVALLFGLHYADMQCGAKLFKRVVIEAIIDELFENQWTFDVEILYLAQNCGFDIIEIPTVWHDRQGSKLSTFIGGIRMLISLFTLKKKH